RKHRTGIDHRIEPAKVQHGAADGRRNRLARRQIQHRRLHHCPRRDGAAASPAVSATAGPFASPTTTCLPRQTISRAVSPVDAIAPPLKNPTPNSCVQELSNSRLLLPLPPIVR